MKHLVFICTLLFVFIGQAQKSDFEKINFDRADSIASSHEGASLKNLPILTYKLTQNLDTQVEQFRAIYTWVCHNIESDHSFGETTLRKRRKLKNDSLSFSNWNNQVLSKVFKRLLVNKKTICSGYAYLIKELSALASIECEIVNGYSRNITRNVGQVDFPNHSWNAVKLNESWYLVDATMASGYFDVGENKFIKDYNDGYFLAAPSLFITRNYPINKTWLLLENKPSLNQFVKGPIVYGKTFKNSVTPISPETLVTTIAAGETVLFKFKIKNKTKIENTRLTISNGLRNETIIVNPQNCNNDIIELEHQFSKKGNYDVHLMVNTDFVVSYTVRVEKGKV